MTSDFIFSRIKDLYSNLCVKSNNEAISEEYANILKSSEIPDYKETFIRPDVLKFILSKKIKPLIKIANEYLMSDAKPDEEIKKIISHDFLRRIFDLGFVSEFNYFVKKFFESPKIISETSATTKIDKEKKTIKKSKLNLQANNFQIISLILLYRNYEIVDHFSSEFESILIKAIQAGIFKSYINPYNLYWDHFVLFVFYFDGSLDIYSICKNIISQLDNDISDRIKNAINEALYINMKRRNLREITFNRENRKYFSIITNEYNIFRTNQHDYINYISIWFIFDDIYKFNECCETLKKNNIYHYLDFLSDCLDFVYNVAQNPIKYPYLKYLPNSHCLKSLCGHISRLNYRILYSFVNSNYKYEKIRIYLKDILLELKQRINESSNCGGRFSDVCFSFTELYQHVEDINFLPYFQLPKYDYFVGTEINYLHKDNNIYDYLCINIHISMLNNIKENEKIDKLRKIDEYSLLSLYKLKSLLSIYFFNKSIKYFHKKCKYDHNGDKIKFEKNISGVKYDSSRIGMWWNKILTLHESENYSINHIYIIYLIVSEYIEKRELILHNFDKCIAEIELRPGSKHYKEGLAMIEEINNNI